MSRLPCRRDTARPEIVALAPYSPARWDPALVRLHANENPWRPAGDLSRAGLNRYPEPQPSALFKSRSRLRLAVKRYLANAWIKNVRDMALLR